MRRHHRSRIAKAGFLAGMALGLPHLCTGHASAQDGPFRPDTVLTPPGSPRIVHLSAPGSPVVALRLSVPFRESAAAAGAGRLLQALGTARADARATAVGARVEGSRTPWGIAYTVVGASADLDYLGYLLREAAAEPTEDRITFDRALADLMHEVRRQDETPGGRVLAALHRDASPEAPPLSGTVGSLERVTPRTLTDLWARTHHAEDMTLTVAGDVPEAVLLASLQGIGAPAGERTAPADAPEPSAERNRVQILRHWYGEAHTVLDGRDPRAAVAAVLLSRRLRRSGGDFEAEVRVWDTDGRRVIAVVGAAYPRRASAMRQAVRSAIPSTAEALDRSSVEAAVSEVRREILVGARTPAGRVGWVGRHADATGDPGAARRYVEALEGIGLEDMRGFLADLGSRTPARAEVRP